MYLKQIPRKMNKELSLSFFNACVIDSINPAAVELSECLRQRQSLVDGEGVRQKRGVLMLIITAENHSHHLLASPSVSCLL